MNIRKRMQAIRKAVKASIAPYLFADCHGACIPCWTRKEAMSWLPYGSAKSAVFFMYGGQNALTTQRTTQ